MGFPGGSAGKESAYGAGNPGSIPGLVGPLEKGMATHASILAWKVHGQRSLTDYSTCGCKEPDTIERLTLPLGFMVYVGQIQVTCRELENEVFNIHVEANFY